MKHREIAARLNEAAAKATACELVKRHTGTWAHVQECGCSRDLIEFRFGSLVIRCRAGAEHIRAVAEKYAKGPRSLRAGSGLPPRELPGRASLRRPSNADALLAELEDKPETEIDRAALTQRIRAHSLRVLRGEA